ncbi:MAG: hypothetical protein HYR56_33745 [Acidobacteria bacterium]|nr:hypothetical protein [Acidobacteriota bacterium]MBI3422924.1 hypothetical protein [Acidobacteriota bacterium]
MLSLAIYLLRLDRVAGLFVDDGWYIMLAKALATGQGYTLINSPSPGILPLYPPGFPFLLSLLYRLYPQFPENVWLFKALSIAALLGAGALVYRFFTQVRQTPTAVALSITAVTLLCPSLVMLATSTVMAEAVFTCNLLATILVIESGVRAAKENSNAKRHALKFILLGAMLASFGFLIRAIAISIIAAIVLYLLNARLWRQAVLFSLTVVLLIAPWLLYTHLHVPTPAQRAEQGGHVTLSYTTQFWQKRASVPELGTIGIGGLPARIAWNAQDIIGRDIGRILVTPIFESLIDPYKEAQKSEVKYGASHGSNWFFSFLLSAIVLLGFISAARERLTLAEVVVVCSLGITLLWPWETYRFVLPLVAFIAFYFALGVGWLFQRLARAASSAAQTKVMTGCALLLAAISLVGHTHYIINANSASPLERPQWLQIFDEAERMMTWIKQSVPRTGPDEGIITTSNPPLLYLYTGHKTVALDAPALSWENWNKVGVRYMVQASIYPEPPDPAEANYKTIYQSRSGMSFRVLDLGDPTNRPAWGATVPATPAAH